MAGIRGVFGAEYICGDFHDCGHEACRERKAKERAQDRRIQDALRGPPGAHALFTMGRWCRDGDVRTYRDGPHGFTYVIRPTDAHYIRKGAKAHTLNRHPAQVMDTYPKYFNSAEDAAAFVDAEIRKRTAP